MEVEVEVKGTLWLPTAVNNSLEWSSSGLGIPRVGKTIKLSQPTRSAKVIKPVKSSKPAEPAAATSDTRDGIGDMLTCFSTGGR